MLFHVKHRVIAKLYHGGAQCGQLLPEDERELDRADGWAAYGSVVLLRGDGEGALFHVKHWQSERGNDGGSVSATTWSSSLWMAERDAPFVRPFSFWSRA